MSTTSSATPTEPTHPQIEVKRPLPDTTRRTEALRTMADAQRALGFRGRLI